MVGVIEPQSLHDLWTILGHPTLRALDILFESVYGERFAALDEP